MSTAAPAIYVSGSNNRASAMEYNFGRTASIPGDVLSAIPSMPSKVFAVLQGMWLEAAVCKRGDHPEECAHRSGRVRYSLSEVARRAFGDDDRDHRLQVRHAIATLTKPIIWNVRTGDVDYEHTIAVLQETQTIRNVATERGIGEVRFATAITDELLVGHYQRLHDTAVQKLRKASWTVFRELFLQPGVHSLKPGGKVEFAVTGADPTLPAWRLGLGGVRRGRLRSSLNAHAQAINNLDIGFSVAVAERAQRLDRRARAEVKFIVIRDSTMRGKGDYFKPEGGLDEATTRASSSQQRDYFKPERGLVEAGKRAQNGSPDGLETNLKTDTDASNPFFFEEDPDLAFLEKRFKHPLAPDTDKLVRRLEKEKGLTRLEAVEVMQAGLDNGEKDPIEALKKYRPPPRPMRTIDQFVEPEPFVERYTAEQWAVIRTTRPAA